MLLKALITDAYVTQIYSFANQLVVNHSSEYI